MSKREFVDVYRKSTGERLPYQLPAGLVRLNKMLTPHKPRSNNPAEATQSTPSPEEAEK